MRIITLNANGIRSAARKGFFDWLAAQDADVVCLQETKAQRDQLADRCSTRRAITALLRRREEGLQRRGASIRASSRGRVVPDRLARVRREGRYLEAQFKGLSVVSLYLPSGSSGEERQQAKFRFLGEFMPHLRALKRKRRDYVLCGDWNIAHKQIDLRNWRSNQKNSGFLPEERAWLDELFGDVQYVDAFREVNPEPDQYTWWSNRGQAWAKNVGWRIDYQVLAPAAARQRRKRGDLQAAALLRPRAARDRLRPVSATRPRREAVVARVGRRRAGVRRTRAWPAMLFLGFSSGLPFLLVFSTLSAWLRESGIERATIGMLSWVGIIYTIKFFWAPVVDRLRLPVLHRLLGRRRSWMLVAQAGIAIGLLNMAHLRPEQGHLAIVAAFALLVAFCSATQDISVDAWRIEAAPLPMQGVMAAAYQLGYRIAYSSRAPERCGSRPTTAGRSRIRPWRRSPASASSPRS